MNKNFYNKSFNEEIKYQKQFLFANKRYWIHIAIWIIISIIVTNALSLYDNKTFKQSTTIKINNNSIDSTTQNERISIDISNNDSIEHNNNKVIINTDTNFFDMIKSDRSTIIFIIISSLVTIIATYIFLLFVIPYARFKKQKRYIYLFIGLEVISAFIYLIVVAIIYGNKNNWFLVTFTSIAVLTTSVQSTFIALFYFLDLYDKQKVFNNYQEILSKRLEAEAKFLSSQVNPHFLFNTLNNIYALTLDDESNALESLKTLESLISYIHNDAQKEIIDLEDEINFIKNYLQLELLRNKASNIRMIFEIDGNPKNKQIAPLLLINFIENAFKHGVKNKHGISYVSIRIDIHEDSLIFKILNSKTVHNLTDQNKKIGGIGINNVKRRLQLIYVNKYNLKINNKKNEYQVILQLNQLKW